MPAGYGFFAMEVNREALLMPLKVMFPCSVPIDNLGWHGSGPHHGGAHLMIKI